MFKKKTFLLFMLLVFGFSQVSLGAEIRKLSLEEAWDMGLQSNYELKIAELRMENARLDSEKNKADNILAASRYSDLQVEMNLIQAESNYTQTKDQVLLTIAQKYLEILKTKQERKLKKKQVEYEEKSLKDLEIQVEKGYKTRIELLRQENTYHNALLSLKKVEDNYYQLSRDFKAKLGLKGNSEIELVEVPTPASWYFHEEEAVELAIKNSLALKALNLQIEMAKIEVERAKVNLQVEWEQKKLENNLDLAVLNEEQTRWELINSVYKQYTSVSQAKEELTLNRTHLAMVKKNYQLVQQQKKAGLISQLEQISAEVELLQAEYQAQIAVASFYQEKWKLQQVLGFELEV